MNKLLKTAALILGLEALAGCTEEYPQYSGILLLDKSSLSNPNFTGEKIWPKHLDLTHRMRYYGTGFEHHLGFRFKGADSEEAESSLQFVISSITRERKSNDYPDGENIYNEKRINGGAFCNSQVQYWISVNLPYHEMLDSIYPAHDGAVSDDPVTNMPREITPGDPEQQYDEDAAEVWFDSVGDNISIDITIYRHLDLDTSGCYKWDGWLPPDKWGDAWSKATYRSVGLNYETNILTAGLDDLADLNDPATEFMEKLIPDVGSSNKW